MLTPTPKQMREMQRQAAAGMVAIPDGQEDYLKCPECGETEFEMKSTFKMVFDRLDPAAHGMIPQTPIAFCKCGYKRQLDPVGDKIITRDIKAQLLKDSQKVT